MFSKARELKRMFTDVKIELRKEWGRSIAMTKADAALIAGNMEGDPRDAFIVIRATGMRPGEVFASRWEYAHLDKLYYQNPKGKTLNSRRAFPSPKAKGGHMVNINKAFNAARDKAGFPTVMVLYKTRHGAGTDLAEVVSLKTVMNLLGHGDTKTAMRYQHPDVSGIQERLNQARTTGRIQ